MGKLKFKIHPLFFIVGIYFVAIGKVFSFLVYTLCALIHELGHSLMAQKCGYTFIMDAYDEATGKAQYHFVR